MASDPPTTLPGQVYHLFGGYLANLAATSPLLVGEVHRVGKQIRRLYVAAGLFPIGRRRGRKGICARRGRGVFLAYLAA